MDGKGRTDVASLPSKIPGKVEPRVLTRFFWLGILEPRVPVRGRALACGHGLQEAAPEQLLAELLPFLAA